MFGPDPARSSTGCSAQKLTARPTAIGGGHLEHATVSTPPARSDAHALQKTLAPLLGPTRAVRGLLGDDALEAQAARGALDTKTLDTGHNAGVTSELTTALYNDSGGFSVGSRISHKTERGLVALDLCGDKAVRAAACSLLALTEGQDAGLLVERMVQGPRELMVGMKRDPLFGPVVVGGVGGIFIEAFKDNALGVTPLNGQDIEGMLAGIRASTPLDDYLGRQGRCRAVAPALDDLRARVERDWAHLDGLARAFPASESAG